MGEYEGIFRRWCRPRSLMNIADATVGCGKHGNELLIRPITGVDQPEIVILSVGPSALRMIIVLKPMETDNLGDRREIPGRRRRAERPFFLGLHRHQMTVVAVSRA